MKKRDFCLFLFCVVCLYYLFSFSIVFELEKIGYREQLRRRRARLEKELKNGQAEQQLAWISDFFQPRCNCPKSGPQDLSHASLKAHQLALHAAFDRDICFVTQNESREHEVDIQVGNLLREVPLRYPQYLFHQSGWVQEMDTSYSANQWQHEPLTVFFVLHSHNDPGWLYTYSTYYNSWTRSILDRAVNFLTEDPTLKFVWAEIVYLQNWYQDATSSQRRKLKKLIRTGQFEIVTGGWVMTDEGVAHYSAMLEQLITGHQWLSTTLDHQPRYGWAIDPFGHSPTMAYLLKRSGLEGTVLQRVHYALKRHLAYRKELEFHWKQTWDGGHSNTALLTHLMPFLYYNIPYSCGPDIQVCCKLDFLSSKCWAWGKFQKPKPITEDNVKEVAEAVLDQLRKKAQFFKHNILLVPHGDDFRYTSDKEWRNQTSNLKRLFNYMNSRPDMRIKISFGTVADYFDAVRSKLSSGIAPPNVEPVAEASPTESSNKGSPSGGLVLPSLSGDFFTYTDRDDQYWSGYFTSRPFLKVTIRHLQTRLRTAEILFTLGRATAARRSPRLVADHVTPLYHPLEGARGCLGLLQHHDAVTGTARKGVVEDYLNRATEALRSLDRIITRMTALLLQLSLDPSVQFNDFQPLEIDMIDKNPVEAPVLSHKKSEEEHIRTIVVHNPLTVERVDIVTFTVTSPDVTVTALDGSMVPCQISPVWESDTQISDTQYKLTILVKLPALGLTRYQLKSTAKEGACPRAEITVFNGKPVATNKVVFQVRHYTQLDKPITIENQALQAVFCVCTGLLKAVTTKMDGAEHSAEMRIVTYGTGVWNHPLKDRSGAYVFLPDGVAQELQYDAPVVAVISGPLAASVQTTVPLVKQTVILYNTTGPVGASVHVENTVDLRTEKNLELAMRLITDVFSDDHSFHTDLNGFQMSRRQTLSRLPLQGNFYPVTSAMFLQDDLFRVTALTGQSHGAASLSPGWLEFMLDRELEQDDWRGLKEGVKDNVPTTSRFVLLWETRQPTLHDDKDLPNRSTKGHKGGPPIEFLSLLGHLSSKMLEHPPVVMLLHQPAEKSKASLTLPKFTPVPFEPFNQPLACDLHLLNLRSLSAGDDPDMSALLVLHRLASDCYFPESYQRCDITGAKVKWTELFSQLRVQSAEQTELTGLGTTRRLHHSHLTVPPMEIRTFKITLS